MRKMFLGLAIILLGALMACGPKSKPVEKPIIGKELPEETQVTGKEPWQVEWEKTLQAAKKEGKVMMYGGEMEGRWVREANSYFKNKYGIALEIVVGRSPEYSARIQQERRAGLYIPDIVFISPDYIYDVLIPGDMVTPIEPNLILPEVLDKTAWYGGELPWIDRRRTALRLYSYPVYLIAHNTNLIKPGEINSLFDLLDPRWKGKIVFSDPTIPAGSSFKYFATLLELKILNLDYFKQLIKQEPVMLTDRHLQMQWLAAGKMAINWGIQSGTLELFMAAGAPVAPVRPKEGMYITSGNSLLNFADGAPHPNARKIFINWLLSREGMSFVFNVLERKPTRIDFSTERLHPLYVLDPKQKYIEAVADTEKFIREGKAAKYSELAKQVFAPLK